MEVERRRAVFIIFAGVRRISVDETFPAPVAPDAYQTIGMMATWLSTIVAVLVIVVKGLFGSKAKRA